MKNEIAKVIKLQEEVDIDVLAHGEPEVSHPHTLLACKLLMCPKVSQFTCIALQRNDMVEYFGEQLNGFVFTENGWVQSYGSRCVKPPVILGDVSRPSAMTVYWSKYAQSLTARPMKGMLTGPVTILNWSFVRNDQPRWHFFGQSCFLHTCLLWMKP